MSEVPESNRSSSPASSTPEEATLARFVEAGRIVQLPAQNAKRRVVLTWLANQFEVGRQYPESEVNDMLRGHSIDHAALRRYLIEYGFLTRTDGMYELAGGEGAEPNVNPEE